MKVSKTPQRGEALHCASSKASGTRTSHGQHPSSANNEWSKAYNMLSRNPKLLTPDILLAALQRQAPHELISFMIEINPQVASVPTQGISPLQVALENSCSLEVIAALLQASPKALMKKEPASNLDPLSYAKMFRSDDYELIELLSHPVEYWLQDLSYSRDTIVTCDLSPIKKAEYDESEKTENISVKRDFEAIRDSMLHRLSNPKSSKDECHEEPSSFLSTYACGLDSTIPSLTVAPQMMRPVKSNTDDPSELKNMKMICMTVLKGHKRLSHSLAEMHEKVDGLVTANDNVTLPNIARMMKSHGKSILKLVKEKQKTFAENQVLALQNTERNMKEYLQHMEVRLAKSIVQRQQATHGKMEVHMDAVVKGLQSRLAKFSNRIEFLEQLVYTSEMKRHSPPVPKADHPPSVITLTFPNRNAFSDEQEILDKFNPTSPSCDTTDTCDETNEVSPTSYGLLGNGDTSNCSSSKIVPNEKSALLKAVTTSDQADRKLTYCNPVATPKRRWFRCLRKKSYVH